jgi:hypothetical protein
MLDTITPTRTTSAPATVPSQSPLERKRESQRRWNRTYRAKVLVKAHAAREAAQRKKLLASIVSRELAAIAAFYQHCPEGYRVEVIVPSEARQAALSVSHLRYVLVKPDAPYAPPA